LEKPVKIVFERPLKLLVHAIGTLLLSTGHSFCADLTSVPAQQSSLAASSSHEVHGAHDPAHRTQSAADDPMSHEGHAPCGPDGSGCQHCIAAHFYKTASTVDFARPLHAPAAFIAIRISDALASSERVYSGSYLAALQRHGPPGDTPVSLKTRLLT
jgi:hypothetical protein